MFNHCRIALLVKYVTYSTMNASLPFGVVVSSQVIGKIGTVVAISDSGDLKIRYPEHIIWTLCPEAVVKVSGERVGGKGVEGGSYEEVEE